VTDAQFQLARQYGFPSWPKLKAHGESVGEVAQLEHAIDHDDLGRVQAMVTHNPALHRAKLGYAHDGPLTLVAECRRPRDVRGRAGVTAERLTLAEWMITHGSDVHQGGDGPLMRAALSGTRVPMMALLVSHGADVNAEWHGEFPIVFAPCETVDPVALAWLLAHGANPNCARPQRRYPGTALDNVLGSYVRRSADLSACIDMLLRAGAVTKYMVPAVTDLIRNRIDLLAAHLDADPSLLRRRFPEIDFGTTGGRRLTLRGGTLLHVAAEYCNLEATTLLLDRGADIDARATVDKQGVGGQTPIFHAVTQRDDEGLRVARLLVERGADLSVRARVPGHYERPDEVLHCTPLGYALAFEDEPWPGDKVQTTRFLRSLGAAE
jgi:hypothetical protein